MVARMIARMLHGLHLGETAGTEIIEFAVSLPLLVVIAVGIYDFGSAFTLKNKLTAAVREGSRVASSQPRPPEVSGACGAPASVCVVRDVVHSTLSASNVEDCGLDSVSADSYVTGSYSWTFNGSCSGL